MRTHFCTVYLLSTGGDDMVASREALQALDAHRQAHMQPALSPSLIAHNGVIYLPANELVAGDAAYIAREQLGPGYDGTIVSFDCWQEQAHARTLAAAHRNNRKAKKYGITVYSTYAVFVLKEEVQVAAVEQWFVSQE